MHTQKLERLIAAAPYIGFMANPYSPMAIGIHTILYINAQNRFSCIFLMVALLRRIPRTTSIRLFFIRTMSAASTATSAPAPMAAPISALVSAGASLMPSPTIMTLPSDISSATAFSLPSGSTPAMTLSTPATFPTASAVLSLSPVSMTTLSPMAFSSLIACALSSFTVSATAMIPRSFESSAKSSGVFPSEARRSISDLSFADISATLLI